MTKSKFRVRPRRLSGRHKGSLRTRVLTALAAAVVVAAGSAADTSIAAAGTGTSVSPVSSVSTSTGVTKHSVNVVWFGGVGQLWSPSQLRARTSAKGPKEYRAESDHSALTAASIRLRSSGFNRPLCSLILYTAEAELELSPEVGQSAPEELDGTPAHERAHPGLWKVA